MSQDRRGSAILSLPAGYDVVRLALAIVLLLAAGLKGYQLATEPVRGTSLLESRWFLILVVEFELLFGFWLIANLYPKTTRWFAVACFAAFTAVSCHKALSGAASCGCFGRVQVNPWITCTLDVGAVVSLLLFAPRLRADEPSREHSARFRHGRRRMTAAFTLWALAGIPAGWAMASPRIGSVGALGLIDPKAKIVLLEPEKWIGKPFPLVEYIDIGDQLRQGDWLVVLYHHDCPECRKLLDRSAELAANLRREALGLAFVEVGLHEAADGEGDEDTCVWGRLADTQHWFAETPSAVFVKDGVVARVSTRAAIENDRLGLPERKSAGKPSGSGENAT